MATIDVRNASEEINEIIFSDDYVLSNFTKSDWFDITEKGSQDYLTFQQSDIDNLILALQKLKELTY